MALAENKEAFWCARTYLSSNSSIRSSCCSKLITLISLARWTAATHHVEPYGHGGHDAAAHVSIVPRLQLISFQPQYPKFKKNKNRTAWKLIGQTFEGGSSDPSIVCPPWLTLAYCFCLNPILTGRPNSKQAETDSRCISRVICERLRSISWSRQRIKGSRRKPKTEVGENN